MVMPNDCGGSLRPLSAWWCSCDPLELDSCLRSRAAASADPAGLGGGLGRGSGGVLADPNHLRLPGTASVALMCRCQKVVASSFVAPFPSAAATTPQVIQKKKIKKEKKQLSKLIDGLFLLLLLMLTPQENPQWHRARRYLVSTKGEIHGPTTSATAFDVAASELADCHSASTRVFFSLRDVVSWLTWLAR